MIQQFFGSMVTLMLAKFMLNDVPHAVFSNPGNPGSSETSDIVSRTGMSWYEYRYFPPSEVERVPRAYPYTRVKNIGHYSVQMTRTNGTCTIKLFEFLEGWKKNLRATWTGAGKPECDAKFEQVAETVKQVRAERVIEMRRAFGR